MENLIGRKFGYLTVKKRGEKKLCGDRKKITWICDCKCGSKNIQVIGENLKNGHTKSCGCRQKETQFKNTYNVYNLTGEYGIGLTSVTNKEFYFDLEDYEKICKYTWNETNKGYLMSSEGILFHRLVTDCPDDYDVDHIYHNKLDNRKSKLRITTTQQNCSNRKKNIYNTSGHKGVTFNSVLNKWVAYIGHNNKLLYLGYSDDLDEMARLRKEAEEKYYGEYSYENSMKNRKDDDNYE